MFVVVVVVFVVVVVVVSGETDAGLNSPLSVADLGVD